MAIGDAKFRIYETCIQFCIAFKYMENIRRIQIEWFNDTFKYCIETRESARIFGIWNYESNFKLRQMLSNLHDSFCSFHVESEFNLCLLFPSS